MRETINNNKNKERLFVSAVLAGLISMAPMSAKAEGPSIEGELVIELQNDYTFSSDDKTNELNDTYTSVELATTFHVNELIDVNTGFLFEAVMDPVTTGPGNDRFFDDHGAYIDTLNIQLNLTENTSVLGGKFAPSFGTAWDVTPGIYGTDFAEDYELSEQIGFAIGHQFSTRDVGSILLTGNVFFTDTTFMSESIINNRGRTRKSAGGAGNTEELDNVSVTLDVGDIKAVEGLSLHLGYRHLSKGVDSTEGENGYVAGFVYEAALSEEVTATFNAEYAHLENSGGGADDATYYTGGVSLGYGQFHLDLAATERDTDVAGGPDTDDETFQISLGYTDSNDIDWNIGYKFSEEGGVDTEVFGIFITTALGFEG